MKNEEFASAHHFLLISSHFHDRLSHTFAEYPRNLEGNNSCRTFAAEICKTLQLYLAMLRQTENKKTRR